MTDLELENDSLRRQLAEAGDKISKMRRDYLDLIDRSANEAEENRVKLSKVEFYFLNKLTRIEDIKGLGSILGIRHPLDFPEGMK